MTRRKNWLFEVSALFLFVVLLSSCHDQYYKTRAGKTKLKYYNQLQFGADSNPKKKF